MVVGEAGHVLGAKEAAVIGMVQARKQIMMTRLTYNYLDNNECFSINSFNL